MFLLKKIKDILWNPRPSFFDVCVGGFLLGPTYLHADWSKGTFIIFYSAFIVAISLVMKPKRQYKSLPLALIAIWSLINVFIHSFEVSTRQITYKILNFEIMTEGFLYVFLAILLIHIVVRYSSNLRFIFFLIPISIIPWYTGLVHMGSVTPVAALGVGIVVYLFLSKRFVAGLITLFIGIIGAITQWPWIAMKWACRPPVWHQLATNIVYRPVRYVEVNQIIDPGVQLSPFVQEFLRHKPVLLEAKPWLCNIFGAGFDNGLRNKYMWVDFHNFGWSYMQNDFLHFAQCLGPIVLILMALFITDCFRKIGKTIYIIPFLMVVLVCFFQLTMWQPGKAIIYLLLGMISVTEGVKMRRSI